MEDYIKFHWLPSCFEWNTQTQEGRTLDREVTDVMPNGTIRKRTVNGKDPLPWSTSKSDPRPHIQLTFDKKKFNLYKYELIWMAHYHQPIPEGCVIHHIDFNKDNNNIENLQLLTEEEHRKIHSKQVVAVDEHNRIVHRFSSTRDAERNGFNHRAVSAACRGCYNRDGNHYFKGLYWYYEQEWLERQ